jgi:hypothetical protein
MMKNSKSKMDAITEPARKLPVYADVDVLVMGGGPAGVATALAAARRGAKTLLAERYAFLGGMATQGLFGSWPRDRGVGAIPYGGIPQQIVDRMLKENSAYLPPLKPRLKPATSMAVINDARFNEDMLKLILGEMMEEAGVHLLYHSPGVAPVMEGDRIRGAIIENKNGRSAILAKIVVDATGDGDIAARAGAPYEKYGDDVYHEDNSANAFTDHHEGSLTPFDLRFMMGNIDWERVDDDAIRECWRLSHEQGSPVQLQGFRRGQHWREGFMTFATLVRGKDGCNAVDLSAGEIALKKAALHFVRALRECPGFEAAHLIKMSHQAEVRGTRRIMGDYVLKVTDVIGGKRFPDTIAVTPPRSQHITAGKPLADAPPGTTILHGIPYRCLLPREVEGLLVAGRCISTEFETFQGHVSIPGCMLLGQAAGIAAALAAKENVTPRHVNVATLQGQLREFGAELDTGIGPA